MLQAVLENDTCLLLLTWTTDEEAFQWLQATAAEARLHQGPTSAASDGCKADEAKLPRAGHVEAVIDLIDDEDEVPPAAATNAQTALACPVCGLVWSSTISNHDMNSHIDQCLNC